MAEIVLFHHAQGLTPGVVAVAEEWRSAGHTVHTPDVYDGHTFATLDEGIAYGKQVGFGRLQEMAVAAVEGLPAELVYAGFSLGVMAAQELAQNRGGALGALLGFSCVPAAEFGAWPAGLRAQVHGMDHDPVFAEEGDLAAARELAAAEPTVEVFTYPGDQHLFVDNSISDYAPEAAALMRERMLAFLAAVG